MGEALLQALAFAFHRNYPPASRGIDSMTSDETSRTSTPIRLTMTQALVRHLAAQFIEIGGRRVRLCGGGFAIFGHGNVICLGEALYAHREALPLWRGQNEQSMAMAAVAYAKQKLRKRFMFATASAG